MDMPTFITDAKRAPTDPNLVTGTGNGLVGTENTGTPIKIVTIRIAHSKREFQIPLIPDAGDMNGRLFTALSNSDDQPVRVDINAIRASDLLATLGYVPVGDVEITNIEDSHASGQINPNNRRDLDQMRGDSDTEFVRGEVSVLASIGIPYDRAYRVARAVSPLGKCLMTLMGVGRQNEREGQTTSQGEERYTKAQDNRDEVRALVGGRPEFNWLMTELDEIEKRDKEANKSYGDRLCAEMGVGAGTLASIRTANIDYAKGINGLDKIA
ncbi:MAG: hypothetical protein FWE38_02615 [Firmicutes bacterium]|nr:hypothetical protein [Bacillota bacterium]